MLGTPLLILSATAADVATETTQHIEAPPRAVVLAVGTGAAPETGAKMDTADMGE